MDRQTLRTQAAALRRAGKSRREIRDTLGISSNRALDGLLRGMPPPQWDRTPERQGQPARSGAGTARPGWTYRDIARALGVSISTCSLWLRDLPPIPEE